MSVEPGGIRPFRTAAAAVRDGVHVLLLDGRPLRLPETGEVLALRTASLADAVAAEWEAAASRHAVRPDTLPLTRFALTAQGRVASDRTGAIADLMRFSGAELLVHRAVAPEALVRAEEREWQPWLDWADRRFGAVLPPVIGVMPAEPPPAAASALDHALGGLSDDALAVLLGIVPLLGSLVLGLALVDRACSPEDAARAALVDQDFETQRWGEEAFAFAERERLSSSVAAAMRFLDLAGGSVAEEAKARAPALDPAGPRARTPII